MACVCAANPVLCMLMLVLTSCVPCTTDVPLPGFKICIQAQLPALIICSDSYTAPPVAGHVRDLPELLQTLEGPEVLRFSGDIREAQRESWLQKVWDLCVLSGLCSVDNGVRFQYLGVET